MFSLLRSFHGLTRFSSQNSIRLNRVSHHKANALHTTLNTSRSNTSMAYWKSKPSLPICINKKNILKTCLIVHFYYDVKFLDVYMNFNLL